MNSEFEKAALIGEMIRSLKISQETGWTDTVECATAAQMCDGNTVLLPEMVEKINHGEVELKDHDWDDYSRGVIFGQIVGSIKNEKIREVAEYAEKLWAEDDGNSQPIKFEYYHQAVEAACREKSPSEVA